MTEPPIHTNILILHIKKFAPSFSSQPTLLLLCFLRNGEEYLLSQLSTVY
jgi:hypothetical protein